MLVLIVVRSIIGEAAEGRVGCAVAMQGREAVDDAVTRIRHGRGVHAERLPPCRAARLFALEQEAGLAVGHLVVRQRGHVATGIGGAPAALEVVVGGGDILAVARKQVAAAGADVEPARNEAAGDVGRAAGPSRDACTAARLASGDGAAHEAVANDCAGIRDTDYAAMRAVAADGACDVHTALATLYCGILRLGGNASGVLGGGRDGALCGEVVDVAREEAEQSGMFGGASQGQLHGMSAAVELAPVVAACAYHGAWVGREVDVGCQPGAEREASRVDAGGKVGQLVGRGDFDDFILAVVLPVVNVLVEPRDAVLHVFLHPSHFHFVRAAGTGIDLYLLAEYGPSHEVEALRLHQLRGRRVDVCREALGRDVASFADGVPHGGHRVAEHRVGEHPLEQSA